MQRVRGAGAPFIKVHAAALPDALLESELFGYEKGAFTGATATQSGARRGWPRGGTLFFDENRRSVADHASEVAASVFKIANTSGSGGLAPYARNVRFIAATHRDLENMVETGGFSRGSILPLECGDRLAAATACSSN